MPPSIPKSIAHKGKLISSKTKPQTSNTTMMSQTSNTTKIPQNLFHNSSTL